MNGTTKKALISIVLILAVIGGTYAATQAFFTAQRTTSSNRFAAGTLDLDVLSNGLAAESFVLDNLGVNGDISGQKEWTVTNTGTLPGRLLVRLANVTNLENGCNDPERTAEPNCDADTAGELGGVITANVSLNGSNVVSSTLATDQQAVVGQQWNALTPVILQPNDTVTVGMNWATSENSYGNEVQSDSVGFDIEFRLVQLINGPTPTN